MGKNKRRARARRNPPLTAMDRHHICWTRVSWNKGYARAIRNAFVRSVPVLWHRELHHLYVHIPDVEFRKAMQFQLDFFATKFEETV